MRGRWGASWSPARAAMLEKPKAAPATEKRILVLRQNHWTYTDCSSLGQIEGSNTYPRALFFPQLMNILLVSTGMHSAVSKNGYVCYCKMEVCRFHFPIAANKWKLPWSIISVFCVYIYIWKTALYTSYILYIHIYIHVRKHICIMPLQTENWSPGDFTT
jgi:hypothetical protein